MREKQLYRDKTKGMVEGVCHGMGDYFNIRPIYIRLAFMIGSIFFGLGAVAYLIAMYNMPNKPTL